MPRKGVLIEEDEDKASLELGLRGSPMPLFVGSISLVSCQPLLVLKKHRLPGAQSPIEIQLHVAVSVVNLKGVIHALCELLIRSVWTRIVVIKRIVVSDVIVLIESVRLRAGLVELVDLVAEFI